MGYYRGYTHKYKRRQYQRYHQPSVRCLFFIEEDTKARSSKAKATALMDVLAVTAFIVVVVPIFSLDKTLLLLLLVVMEISEGITGVGAAVASDQSGMRRR